MKKMLIFKAIKPFESVGRSVRWVVSMANVLKLTLAPVRRVMSLQKIANTYANPLAFHHVEMERALESMNANVMKVLETCELVNRIS